MGISHARMLDWAKSLPQVGMLLSSPSDERLERHDENWAFGLATAFITMQVDRDSPLGTWWGVSFQSFKPLPEPLKHRFCLRQVVKLVPAQHEEPLPRILHRGFHPVREFQDRPRFCHHHLSSAERSGSQGGVDVAPRDIEGLTSATDVGV